MYTKTMGLWKHNGLEITSGVNGYTAAAWFDFRNHQFVFTVGQWGNLKHAFRAARALKFRLDNGDNTVAVFGQTSFYLSGGCFTLVDRWHCYSEPAGTWESNYAKNCLTKKIKGIRNA